MNMEMVLMVVLAIGLVWYLGGLKTGRRAVDMANREVMLADSKHKLSVANDMAALDIDAEKVQQAKEKQALLDSLNF
jgi:hypothetical protein